MLGRLATVILVGALLGTALPAQGAAPAGSAAVIASPKQVRKFQKLQADAAKQTGSKRSETLAKLAEMDYSFAAASFAAGQSGPAQHHLDRATGWANQAMAILRAEAAAGKTNGMKNVEISFQKITFGLHGLAEQVRLHDRPAVQAADNHFAQLRAQLLKFMFAPRKK